MVATSWYSDHGPSAYQPFLGPHYYIVTWWLQVDTQITFLQSSVQVKNNGPLKW